MNCEQCSGALEYLGVLGRRVFGRCRQCGSVQGVAVCHECLGTGELATETGALEPCQECGGTLERPTHYGYPAAAPAPVARQLPLPPM